MMECRASSQPGPGCVQASRWGGGFDFWIKWNHQDTSNAPGRDPHLQEQECPLAAICSNTGDRKIRWPWLIPHLENSFLLLFANCLISEV